MKVFAAARTDHRKRSTLKRLGLLAASTSLVGLSTADAANDTMTQVPLIDVHTRISAVTNDLEIVISNTGSADADIRQLLPSMTSTARGTFDFNAITDDNGRLALASGDQVTVPLQHHTVVLDGSNVAWRAHSLTDTLRRSMSVQLANGQPARLRVRGLSPLA